MIDYIDIEVYGKSMADFYMTINDKLFKIQISHDVFFDLVEVLDQNGIWFSLCDHTKKYFDKKGFQIKKDLYRYERKE